MEVKILYFAGCPNWEKAAARARIALAELGRTDVPIQHEDIAQIPRLPRQWAGSPTVLIDGQDPFEADGDGPGDHGRSPAPVPGRDACRIYRAGTRLEGAPTVDQLRIALKRAFVQVKDQERS
jgi:hypothetical protein